MRPTVRRTATRTIVDSAAGRPDVVWLDNGVLAIGAVPDLGGRILAVRVDGRETLWRNADLLDDDLHPVAGHRPAPVGGPLSAWHNYGGDKTWPAPQGWSGPGEWAGPPDPVLDSGPYAWTLDETAASATLTMTSAADPRTGLVIERSVSLGSASRRYSLRVTARNASARTVRWSLWNVTQRRAGPDGVGGVDIGVDPASPGVDVVVPVLAVTGVPRHANAGAGRVRVPHQRMVGKVGFPTASGWLSHSAGGTTSTVTFEVDRAATYPDGGSRAEVWLEHPLEAPVAELGGLDPPDRIVEVEVLGPLRVLAPGETTSLQLWCAAVAEEVGEVLAVDAEGHDTPEGRTPYLVGAAS